MKNFKEMQIEFERYIKSREKELANNFKDTFEDVRKELLKIYEKYEVDNKIDFDELRKYNRLKKFDDIVLSSIAANSLLNKKATNKILNDVINKTEKESLEIVNTQVTIQAIKRNFDTKALINKEVAGKAWEERLKHHTANFMYDVHGIVRRGLEQGDSYTTMARNVKKKFRKEVKKELFLVRTEARRIQEFTKFETMREVDKQVGLVKIWHTMKDEAVRSTHQAMEGVEVELDEEFELPSGATCLTPTGTGIPEEDCNCRCFVEYKVADEGIKAIDEIDDEKENTDNQGKYTREEINQALENYVSGDGMWINNHLRGIGEAADYPLNEDDKIYLEKLDQATKANIVKEKTLYRSTDISSVLGDMSDLDYDNLKSAYLYNDKSKPAQEALEKYLKNIEGKEIIDKGFMSTTKSKDIALDFQDFTGSSKPCVIEFNVANGVQGIDLKDFDIADMEQKEVLLARNQKFVIREVRQEQGQFYFKADLIPNNGYNIKKISLAENFEDLSNCLDSKSIKLDETVKNLNFNMVKRTLSSIVETADKYPGAFENLKIVTTSSEGVMSCSGSKITFNPEYYDNIDKLNAICKDCSDSGWWIKNSSIESLGVHEFGHSINWDLINKNPYIEISERVHDWNNEETAKKIVSQACKEIKKTKYGEGLKYNEIRARQSEYGATKATEAIAESYADIYANKNNANPLSKKIVEIIDTLFEEYANGGE